MGGCHLIYPPEARSGAVTMKSALENSTDESLVSGTSVYARLLGPLERSRPALLKGIDPKHRAEMGQFFTPEKTASLMAEMFQNNHQEARFLDAAAGCGVLTAAWTAALCSRSRPAPKRVSLTAYEIEPAFIDPLRATLISCVEELTRIGVQATWRVVNADFIEAAVELLAEPLFQNDHRFTGAIQNPPYRKIHSHSRCRKLLSSVGIETGNLYTAFLALTVRLLEPGGELVAISPRSFCNGPYFKPFRKLFLHQMTLRRIHVFESRDQAFREDEVLQENIIFNAVKEQNRTCRFSKPNPREGNPNSAGGGMARGS
jgi:adenine-specific DNA-methyltransferase